MSRPETITLDPWVGEDVRPVTPAWHQLLDLVDGARHRGYTQDQIDYLRAVVGVCWTKAFRAGQLDAAGVGAARVGD